MNRNRIRAAEWIVAILLSALVLFLFFVRATHAGGLWRDEATSVQLARMSSWAEIAQNYQFDSFPSFFVAILRGYTTVFTDTDISLRIFGFLVGVALLCVLWFNSRSANTGPPLLATALIGLNTIFLVVGTSIRAYGLGTVLILLAFGLTAKFVREPTTAWFAATVLAYLLAAHCLFFNIAYVAVIGVSAASVFFLRGTPKPAFALLLSVALCAASYIPYLQRYSRSRDWLVLLKYPQSLDTLRQQFLATCGAPFSIMPWVWLVILFFSMIGAGRSLVTNRRDKAAPEWALLLFAFIVILLSVPAHFAFAQLLHDPLPNTRYYLALFCLLAAGADLIITNLARFDWIRLARLAVVVPGMIALSIADWPHILERETNVDLLAERLNHDATAADLVIVRPWYIGVTFNRYYRGPARWMTVPEMSDHRTHRWDLMKAKMLENDPLADLRRAIFETLESGHRVWLVGGAAPPEPGQLLRPPPAPDPEHGWSNQFYSYAWSMQLGEFLGQHVLDGHTVVEPGKGVNNQENIALLVAAGWRD